MPGELPGETRERCRIVSGLNGGDLAFLVAAEGEQMLRESLFKLVAESLEHLWRFNFV